MQLLKNWDDAKSSLENFLNELEWKINDLMGLKDLKSLQSQIDELKNLTNQIPELKNTSDSTNQLVKDLQQRLDEISAVIPELEQQFEELKDMSEQIPAIQEELKNLANQIPELKNTSDNTNQLVKDLQQRLDEISAVIPELKQQFEELKDVSEQIPALQEELKNLTTEMQNLKDEIEQIGGGSGENWELIYDMTSENADVNLGYPDGILAGTTKVANMPNLKGYKKLKVVVWYNYIYNTYTIDLDSYKNNNFIFFGGDNLGTVLVSFSIGVAYESANDLFRLYFSDATRIDFYSSKYPKITAKNGNKLYYISKIEATA